MHEHYIGASVIVLNIIIFRAIHSKNPNGQLEARLTSFLPELWRLMIISKPLISAQHAHCEKSDQKKVQGNQNFALMHGYVNALIDRILNNKLSTWEGIMGTIHKEGAGKTSHTTANLQ